MKQLPPRNTFVPPDVVLNGISHDIRRTLSGIVSSVEDLQAVGNGKGRSSEWVGEVLVESVREELRDLRKRLSNLVNDADDGDYKNFAAFYEDVEARVAQPLARILDRIRAFQIGDFVSSKSRQEPNFQERGQQLDLIVTSIRRTRESLLALSKFADVGQEIQYRPINIEKEIERIEIDLANIIRRSGRNWDETVIVNGDVTISTSQFAVASIFGNIIANAIVHGEKRRLTINIDVRKITLTELKEMHPNPTSLLTGPVDWAHVIVEDNGIGIRKRDRRAIFELFRKAGSKRSRSNGDGVGLSLVAYALELLGGGISLRSSRRDGAVFEVFLPNGPTSGKTSDAIYHVGAREN